MLRCLLILVFMTTPCFAQGLPNMGGFGGMGSPQGSFQGYGTTMPNPGTLFQNHGNNPNIYDNYLPRVDDYLTQDPRKLNEYNKHIQEQDSSYRLRNKITLKFPVKFTKWNIQPYLADELFFDFDNGDMNRNRFYAGFIFDIVENLKGDLFYLLQSTESSNSWNDYNVLGSKLKLSF